MKCPHCGKPITAQMVASAFSKIPSERKVAASIQNGKLGGRPKKMGRLAVPAR